MSDFNSQNNRIVWVDIPVVDLDRSVQFYAEVLQIEVSKEKFDNFEFAVLQHENGNGGCLVVNESGISSNKGPLIYMNVDGRIRDAVDKTTMNAGKVIEEVHSIGPHGFRAIILDSEGNRIVLHSDTDA